MKSFCLAAICAVLVAGCASTSPHASSQASQPVADNYPFNSHPADNARPESSASKSPRLVVGTRYPDEPLTLPVILDGAVNAVNAR